MSDAREPLNTEGLNFQKVVGPEIRVIVPEALLYDAEGFANFMTQSAEGLRQHALAIKPE